MLNSYTLSVMRRSWANKCSSSSQAKAGWLFTISQKAAPGSRAARVASSATTLAERFFPSMPASSPKISPGPTSL